MGGKRMNLAGIGVQVGQLVGCDLACNQAHTIVQILLIGIGPICIRWYATSANQGRNCKVTSAAAASGCQPLKRSGGGIGHLSTFDLIS